MGRSGLYLRIAPLILTGLILAGCGNLSVIEEVVLGTTAGAVYGGRTPAHEIQQTYYLGVFDPQEQLPPTVYRVRLHGQANALSFVKFASGWLPAATVDSLGTTIAWEQPTDRNSRAGSSAGGAPAVQANGLAAGIVPTGTDAKSGPAPSIFKGRRLVLFGPEGFREAPADHRLVIAMGTDPQAYFDASNQAMGVIAQAMQKTGDSGTIALQGDLFEALKVTLARRKALAELKVQVAGMEP